MTPTILSLWLPHLPTDRLAAIMGHPAGAPAPEGAARDGAAPSGGPGPGRVTAAKVKGAQRLVAVDARAGAAGLRPGAPLADARAMCPDLLVHPADPAADARLLDEVAAWCSRFTPLVGLDGTDGLLLDISGAAHLFGGEAALMQAATRGMRSLGLEARGAVAATSEAAWALARHNPGLVAPAPDTPAFRRLVEPLPLAALRLDAEALRIMAQAGLRQVGDLLWRPRAPLAARFGQSLFSRLDGLMGLNRSPISPRFEPPAFVVEQRFASPIATTEAVERTLQSLAGTLCALMERERQGARLLELRLFRVDGAVKRLQVGASRPLVEPGPLVRLFAERLAALGEEGLDTGYGFDVVRLGAVRSEAALPRQRALVEDGPGAGEALDALVDRLGARLGAVQVGRLGAQDTHIPERASPFRPAVERPGAQGRGDPDLALGVLPARPVRLFARPEPIEAVAAVPDGPPVRFWWRRGVHEVAAVEGPERIAPEWWRGGAPAMTRDYFRAEDKAGRQFWLFREGLLPDETVEARWFVHGLFG